MAKCTKCGLVNEKGCKRCVNCGASFFMGFTVLQTYKYSPFQKVLLTIFKYFILFFGVWLFFNSFNGYIDFRIFFGGDIKLILMALVIILYYLFLYFPVYVILFFVYKLIDFSIKNSDNSNSVDIKK